MKTFYRYFQIIGEIMRWYGEINGHPSFSFIKIKMDIHYTMQITIVHHNPLTTSIKTQYFIRVLKILNVMKELMLIASSYNFVTRKS